jgi:2-polyprenyl-3-methyl-5-hydroxy-6-metoxy-1,4-benzoquinol methylase
MPLSKIPTIFNCPCCGSQELKIFLEIQDVPVLCNILCETKYEALSIPRGDIQLTFCKRCGHIYNALFDRERVHYSQNYENSLHFSPTFQEYAQTLAAHLVEKYLLVGKNLIEIGCGQGTFLDMLCQLGNNRGIGFDRSYRHLQSAPSVSDRITFVQEEYSETNRNETADFICCRHVLEHIPQPTEFVSIVRSSIGNRKDTVVFFEVPNALFMLRELAIWDIIYEHCSYFTHHSLIGLFRSCGFEVQDCLDLYEGQFLGIEAVPREGTWEGQASSPVDIGYLHKKINVFAEEYGHKKKVWQDYLEQWERQGQRPIIWGAGSKGVTFLNMVKIQTPVEYVVDVNPRKQGKFLAGSGQQIVCPDYLRDYQPDFILLMNPIYRAEVQGMANDLGIQATIMTV